MTLPSTAGSPFVELVPTCFEDDGSTIFLGSHEVEWISQCALPIAQRGGRSANQVPRRSRYCWRQGRPVMSSCLLLHVGMLCLPYSDFD